ncbi:hypothetical protein CW304_26160 [Bacillus sp. UFRGS-B20]|nr:hypothetical protein CW304_26160 [Bacillus sp. UFRGS-B20]
MHSQTSICCNLPYSFCTEYPHSKFNSLLYIKDFPYLALLPLIRVGCHNLTFSVSRLQILPHIFCPTILIHTSPTCCMFSNPFLI